jgi:hypothetical protein
MRHAGLIYRFATLARSETASLRSAALIAIVALAVTLQGLGLGCPSFGACCPRPDAYEIALPIADPICETGDPHGGAPRGHAEHAPCCLTCPPGPSDKTAVAMASPVAAPASPMCRSSDLRDGPAGGDPAHTPLGWASSWSSRAPPSSSS